MPRKFAMLLALSGIFASSLLAQGLTTQASKDDWEEINFEFNSAVLSDGYPSLLCLADRLQKNRGYHVKIEGNTDNIGSERSNEKLGLARATTVKQFLVKYGAQDSQIDVSTRGKRDQKYPGFKPGYSKTDVARWMNRRVVLTVTDESGKTIAAGCNEVVVVQKPPPAVDNGPSTCCTDILRKLDEISKLLGDLKNENSDLRSRIAKLETGESTIQSTINNLPKPPTTGDIENIVKANNDPRFSLLGVNAGLDNNRNLTFTGSGRFFAPFKGNFAVQAQGEYMYFRDQKEGQGDIGLVNRIGNFQGGLFASFKNVSIRGAGNSATLGQGAAMFEYIFSLGKIGVFGTKSFMNNAILDTRGTTFTDASGNTVIAPNLFTQRYLHVADQAGIQETLALWKNVYMEANYGYMHGIGPGRSGGTLRFIFPLSNKVALTIEGGVNETLIGPSNTGRAVIGFQFGNFIRPRDFITFDHPVPMQVPRVKYELLSRTLHRGVSPPVADAGPDQIGVNAGTITLNGSGSRDPNGEVLTYQWVQEAGPAVAISNANQPIATFTAAAGQNYSFRLTVRNTDGQQASARTRVTTTAALAVDILFFTANPTNINLGQAATLSWRVLNATTVTITPGPGTVNPTNGSIGVSPTATTTYTLTASNATTRLTATATVVVATPQAQILVCTASPMNITQGESATIFYQTTGADTVSIAPTVGNVGKSGSVVVSPTTNTNYIITAANAFGSTTCSVAVQVTAGAMPRIVRFSASPLTIASGSTSTLLWAVDNATSVTIDQAIGTVDNRTGTRDVTPAATTTYTLTATNSFGSVTAQVTVTVTQVVPPPPAPTITSFTASPPQSPNAGAPVVLSCQATNAKQVVISGVGPVSSGGTLTVNPQTTTTYVCVAVGPTGLQASSNLTVPVGTTAVATGTGPTVVITSPTAGCTPASTPGGTTVCQTVVRTINLDLTGSSSPNGGLTYTITSRNTSSVVLNPNSPTPTVQLGELFGDYFFDVTVTDAKGLSTTSSVDVQLVVTRVR